MLQSPVGAWVPVWIALRSGAAEPREDAAGAPDAPPGAPSITAPDANAPACGAPSSHPPGGAAAVEHAPAPPPAPARAPSSRPPGALLVYAIATGRASRPLEAALLRDVAFVAAEQAAGAGGGVRDEGAGGAAQPRPRHRFALPWHVVVTIRDSARLRFGFATEGSRDEWARAISRCVANESAAAGASAAGAVDAAATVTAAAAAVEVGAVDGGRDAPDDIDDACSDAHVSACDVSHGVLLARLAVWEAAAVAEARRAGEEAGSWEELMPWRVPPRRCSHPSFVQFTRRRPLTRFSQGGLGGACVARAPRRTRRRGCFCLRRGCGGRRGGHAVASPQPRCGARRHAGGGRRRRRWRFRSIPRDGA